MNSIPIRGYAGIERESTRKPRGLPSKAVYLNEQFIKTAI